MSAEDYFDIGGELADFEAEMERIVDCIKKVETEIDALYAKLGDKAKTNKRYLYLLKKRDELYRMVD